MKKFYLILLLTFILIGSANAQKTIYYVSDYNLDLLRKEKFEEKAVFSFTQSTISLQWAGRKYDLKILKSESIKEENMITYWTAHSGKDGKKTLVIIEVLGSYSENEYPMISYRIGENILLAFHTIDSYIRE
ncbi:hypothetical protein JAO76_14900 [Pontibacter sp. BT310]|uniref:MoaF C-terminal domain-containing protein n=1 Tax=Pontibacter populi TaxID=890055 RepID=A0ABS6XEG3_9BACT|nr:MULTISPECIES: hypothetical protein [Pontibacter]MBJ6119495.1 hypothetical protein [Pontibacter sp. BT310]MBR0571923.1 hypothetical protein [Microvirga sp. STS03]MBW3366349.1 hypothetical protein [Pontibacter populi]